MPRANYIDNSAFSGCTELDNFIIPKMVTTIGSSAFENCINLSSIDIPDAVTSIGYEAFYNCSKLKSVTIGKNVTSLSGDNRPYFDGYTFADCSALTSIVLPEGLREIPKYTFSGCSHLKEVVINKNVTNIYNGAFEDCSDLAKITCYAKMPPALGQDVFLRVDVENAELVVPSTAMENYKSTDTWKGFNIKYAPVRTDVESESNLLYVQDLSTLAGKTITLSLRMKHTQEVSGFQANLYLPEGFTIEKVARGDGIKGVDDDEEYLYKFSNSVKDDGSRFFLCYSITNTPMPEGDIEVAKMTVNVPENAEPGDYAMILRNGELAYGENNIRNEYAQTTLTITELKVGDANKDGITSVGDITTIASHLLGDELEKFDENAADVNGDGAISVGDITALAEYMLSSSLQGK